MRRLRRVLHDLADRRRAHRAARRNRSDGRRCFYCDAAFEPTGPLARTVDHRVPRAVGGTDGLANLVFACQACNQRKANRPEDDFVASAWLEQRRRDVAAHRSDSRT
jgi:5-methylcytosine-specific restriction endonuclease McrA